ncbi:MAG: hypothetical protein ACLTE2_12820 [Eubacteriales bacterium]
MNYLTDAGVLAKDMLFANADPAATSFALAARKNRDACRYR